MRNDQNTTELYRIVKPRWRKANITVRSLGTKKSNSAEPNLLMRLLYDISYTGRQRVNLTINRTARTKQNLYHSVEELVLVE